MREVIEKVLEKFSHLQPNMASKSLRELLATEIVKALKDDQNITLAKENK